MGRLSVGSICSGIEAASVAWKGLPFDVKWLSEISKFPSKLLSKRYPNTPNLGDLRSIPDLIKKGEIHCPDIICGGTPCQAFSLAGLKRGLADDRGNLTIKFIEVVDANDVARKRKSLQPTVVLWENVEGVLTDKTNAFGCFLGYLAGVDEEIRIKNKWPKAGVLRGPKRTIAWRVLDAKYFGLAQQRRRLYVVAGGTDFSPEHILFEEGGEPELKHIESNLVPMAFKTRGQDIEIFRHYTDCLYSAYGTKWNGNAAAYNGSLFISQNGLLRRLTPLECERLMGFPDNYTNIEGSTSTARYQAIGNSWAIPVIRWIGQRMVTEILKPTRKTKGARKIQRKLSPVVETSSFSLWYPDKRTYNLSDNAVNTSVAPIKQKVTSVASIIDVNAAQNYYITPAGCKGILRRSEERQVFMNQRLRSTLNTVAGKWTDEKIELISRKQPRGKLSRTKPDNSDLPLFFPKKSE